MNKVEHIVNHIDTLIVKYENSREEAKGDEQAIMITAVIVALKNLKDDILFK